MQAINFSELALAMAAAGTGKHPRGDIKVTVNHRTLMALDLLRNADGTAYSMTLIIQRANEPDGSNPQRVRLPATMWIKVQGKSVTYRQAGRGNYTFNFYDAATGEHLCPHLFTTSFGQAEAPLRQAA